MKKVKVVFLFILIFSGFLLGKVRTSS
ncbi:TPA: colicin release lysis protein [Klebsiella pneumoniae]|nr:colicin release lysis protein [Klebsiella pneumoniae]HBS9244609.1 colicin release lysis protein [Klebsiella pneumoniae]